MAAQSFAGNALDFSEKTDLGEPPHIIALAGPERFLHLQALRRILSASDSDSLTRFSEGEIEWSRVRDDLATLSLFGSGPRYVLVDAADSFVSEYRTELEEYAKSSHGNGILILQVDGMLATTKLYKNISLFGWVIECRLPEIKAGKNKIVDEARMRRWLDLWAREHHQIRLAKDARDRLCELVGWEIGILDQELAKLSLFVPKNGDVSAALVDQVVGGWRAQTNWDMLDAACDGNAAEAIRQLDHLLQSGEAPQALFGSISWSLRRFVVATRMVQRAEKAGRSPNLAEFITQAAFYGNAAKKAETQLKQMTRARSGQLYRWLLETDLALKGSHSSPMLARWALEQLFLRLAKEAKPTSVLRKR